MQSLETKSSRPRPKSFETETSSSDSRIYKVGGALRVQETSRGAT